MGRPGGYYSGGEFVGASPEELAERKRDRDERKNQREIDRTWDQDNIKDFVWDRWSWSHNYPSGYSDLDNWDGTRASPTLEPNRIKNEGKLKLMDDAGKYLKTDDKGKQARFLDLARSRYNRDSKWFRSKQAYFDRHGNWPEAGWKHGLWNPRRDGGDYSPSADDYSPSSTPRGEGKGKTRERWPKLPDRIDRGTMLSGERAGWTYERTSKFVKGEWKEGKVKWIKQVFKPDK